MPKLHNPYLEVAPAQLCSEEFARQEDDKDPLSKLRQEFNIPTKGDLRNEKYGFIGREADSHSADDDHEEAIYFCGNSLGLQPRRTKEYVSRYLDTWASKGVFGHFTDYEGGLPPWLHLDDVIKEQTAKLVGALPSEVVIMETLTANLHLLMASFYKPTKERWKIIIEGKAFPSDHYAALSQLAHHDLDPSSLVTISPPSSSSPYLSTEHTLSVISQHAATTALVLLPGIQFYSGQFFDIELITRHCQSLGIVVGWDLAHATGNVPLQLHDWNVDFAAWCNYKYMNGGPGVIGGAFVHERHGTVQQQGQQKDAVSNSNNSANSSNPSSPPTASTQTESTPTYTYKPRLSGWWGSSKSTRFAMSNTFIPIPGASGFQLSNPSALDMTAVMASLDVFSLTTISALRERSLRLTGYLEARLLTYDSGGGGGGKTPPYKIITPSNPAERGAQLSVLLDPGLLEPMQKYIEEKGVVVDERKPDVLRVAPAPLYNSFMDVHRFVDVFQEACRRAVMGKGEEREDGVPGGIACT